MSYIEGVARHQIILFPEKIDDYVREDNPVPFIDAFVDSLDLRVLGFNRAQVQETGRPHRNLEVIWPPLSPLAASPVCSY